MSRAKPVHLFIILLLAFVWGSSFILMKRGLKDSSGFQVFSPAEVAALRLSIAGLVLLPVSIKAIRKLRKTDWKWLVAVGCMGSGIPAFLFTNSQQYIDSSVAGILNALTPLFTLILGILFFAKKVHTKQVTGVLIGLIGAIWLVSLRGFGDSENWNYSLLIIVATFCYGVSVNVIASKLKHIAAIEITGLSLLIVGLPSGLYTFTSNVFETIGANPSGWSSLGYVATLAILGTAVANALFFRLTQETNAIFAASVTYLIPVVAVFWGVFDDEKLTLMHVLCGGIILAGVWLVNSNKKVVS